MAIVDEILRFWFGNNDDDLKIIEQQHKIWFGKNEQVDQQIADRFGPHLGSAAAMGVLPGKGSEAKRLLATILLFDQFTRNMFRDQPQAFAYDGLALKLAENALANGVDTQMRPVERVFMYLPLEHSEDMVRQDRAVELFGRLCDEVPSEWRDSFAGFHDYALRHQVVIARFGRFPHRNRILGRQSTAEELEFLQLPNSSF